MYVSIKTHQIIQKTSILELNFVTLSLAKEKKTSLFPIWVIKRLLLYSINYAYKGYFAVNAATRSSAVL